MKNKMREMREKDDWRENIWIEIGMGCLAGIIYLGAVLLLLGYIS